MVTGALWLWPSLAWSECHVHLAEPVVHARRVNAEVLRDRRQGEARFVQFDGVLHVMRPKHVATVDYTMAVKNRCDR